MSVTVNWDFRVILILTGVSGSGKTTIGRLLEKDLGWRFYDGDDYHSLSNINKMKRGAALNDHDRKPWLTKLNRLIKRINNTGESAIISCSALKEKYRKRLKEEDSNLCFIYLKGDFSLIKSRLEKRTHRFFDPVLIKSQFDSLEEPEDAITIEIDIHPETIVSLIKKHLTRIIRAS